MRFPLLTTIYGLPLLAVLVLFLVPERRALAIKIVSLTASAAALGLALALFFTYDRAAGGLQFVERVPWLRVLGINYFVGVNGINVMLLLLTGIIITAGVLASWDVVHRSKEFFILLLTLATGVFGVFMAYNLFLFFLFYELAVLPMYLLIGIWGTGRKEYAAMKLTLYLMAGSALILAGILGLYFASGQGSFDFDVLERTTYDPRFQRVFFPILFVGFGILAALWPFHTWSPDGHSSAPTAVSMLHAGVLMKLGAYGCLLVPITLLPGGRALLASLGGFPVHREHRLWVPERGRAERPEIHRGLFERQPHGHRHAGARLHERDRPQRGGAADVLPRHHDGALLRPRWHDLWQDAYAYGQRAGGPCRPDAGPRGVLRSDGAHFARPAGSERLPRRAFRLPRRLPSRTPW